LSYRVEKNGGLVNAVTGQKSDNMIEIPNGVRGEATQAVKKMMIEAMNEDDKMDRELKKF